jgi:hypothetical protein
MLHPTASSVFARLQRHRPRGQIHPLGIAKFAAIFSRSTVESGKRVFDRAMTFA